eukprot:1998511-Pyramimonas_sp.AAC.1
MDQSGGHAPRRNSRATSQPGPLSATGASSPQRGTRAHAACHPSLVHRENIPALPASDWSIVRIYPHFLRLIGPS